MKLFRPTGKEYHVLWIPAEELEELNRHIAGKFRVVDIFKAQ